jgi:hypothetical protein
MEKMMQTSRVVEGAVTAGVNRALYAAADATHHIISTPTNMMVEGVKSATVFIATHIVVGGLKLGATAGWWLLTTTASLVGVAVGASASVTYNTLFAPRTQPKLLTWNDSYDVINIPSSKSVEDSTQLFETSPATTPRAASPRPTNNVADID